MQTDRQSWEGASHWIPSSPVLELQQRHLVLTSRKDLEVLKLAKQLPTLHQEPSTRTMMGMETVHGEGWPSRDRPATDICCTDTMSAKLRNMECSLNPSGWSFITRKLYWCVLNVHQHISWHIKLFLSFIYFRVIGHFKSIRIISFLAILNKFIFLAFTMNLFKWRHCWLHYSWDIVHKVFTFFS